MNKLFGRLRSCLLRMRFRIAIMQHHKRITCKDIHSVRFYQHVTCAGRGMISVGSNVQFGYDIGGRYKGGYIELQTRSDKAVINIGDRTAINNNFLAIAHEKIKIGDDCRIGINCQMMDFDAHDTNPLNRSAIGKIRPINIMNNVWIGNNVIILPGVTIGENAVVAAGAVVTHDIAENTIVGGVPAKFIKTIDFSSESEENEDDNA